MNKRYLAFLPFAIALFFATLAHSETLTIKTSNDFAIVEKQLNQSEASEIRIVIEQGLYTLSDTFNIERSNIEIIGQNNPIIRLEKGTNKPVISIGTQREFPQPSDIVSNISLFGITVDGNKNDQSSEYHPEFPWIRNNGIDVRATENLHVDHINANNNRSGGLVISWACKKVLVSNSFFSENYFDGIAYYDSEDVFTVSCQMINNDGAGISLDNNFRQSYFADCVIAQNKDVGIFVRNSSDLLFDNCRISDSKNWGSFLSHDEQQNGVCNIFFNQCHLKENFGGIYLGSVNESQSKNIHILKTEFESNGKRPNVESAGVPITETPESTPFSKINDLGLHSFEQVASIFYKRSSLLQKGLN